MKNEFRNPLRRSFQILRYLLSSREDTIGVRKMAAELEMAPSSVHRLLAGLVEEGLVRRRDDSGLYSLGLEIIRLAHLGADRLPLHKVAAQHLRELVAIANETALVAAYDPVRQEMMYVAEVESNQPLRYINRLWEWMPVYAGAGGLAIMAHLPAAEQREIIARTGLKPITDRTITEAYKLEHQFALIRERRYALSIGQRTPGAVAIGAPIFGAVDNVVGDVIITLPEQRYDPASEAYLAEHVVRCAERITRQLGGTWPDSRPHTGNATLSAARVGGVRQEQVQPKPAPARRRHKETNMNARLNVAIVGAGMGGLTAASTLARIGATVNVYEQAGEFTRIGSGIQMSPNAMKVLRGIGLEVPLRRIAFRPEHQLSRDWDTGKINLDYPFGDVVEERYGAPYLLLHRGDLHALLASLIPEEHIHRGKRVVGLDHLTDGVRLYFQDGTSVEADAVIGADGVHSFIRQRLLGPERPHYSGRVAYRTTFPASLLRQPIDDCAKWWGVDRHIVMYYTTRAKDEVYFVTSVPEAAWTEESWSLKASTAELRAAFVGFHPSVTGVLEVCPQVNKWAIFERDPLPGWTQGNVVLIGDACHPMTPYMAQGAATSMEDAVVLARCLEGVGRAGIHDAFELFEQTRKERTSMIQLVSHQNVWLHRSGNTDWVFGYDAWNTDLAAPVGAG